MQSDLTSVNLNSLSHNCFCSYCNPFWITLWINFQFYKLFLILRIQSFCTTMRSLMLIKSLLVQHASLLNKISNLAKMVFIDLSRKTIASLAPIICIGISLKMQEFSNHMILHMAPWLIIIRFWHLQDKQRSWLILTWIIINLLDFILTFWFFSLILVFFLDYTLFLI